jgi:DNA-directed RNA polymerase specialized sigma24 family protein
MANISELEEQHRRAPCPETRDLLTRGIRAELLRAFGRYHDLPEQVRDELAQEYTMKLLGMFDAGQPPQGTGAALVSTVAFRAYVSWRRSRDAREWRGSADLGGEGWSHEPDVQGATGAPLAHEDLEEQDLIRHRLELIGEALKELSPTDRALIRAVYLEVPPATVQQLVEAELRQARHEGKDLDEAKFRKLAYDRIGQALRRARKRLQRHVLVNAARQEEV